MIIKTLLIAAFGFLALLPSLSYASIGTNYRSWFDSSTDFARFNSVGLNQSNFPIRTGIDWATHTPATTLNMQYAQGLKDLGYYVVGGGRINKVDTSTWPSFHDAQINWAIYARDHGNLSEFQLGNEDETHGVNGFSGQQIRAGFRALATDIKAIWPTSTLSYSVAGYCNDTNKGAKGWIDDGTLGDIDIIHLNSYGNYSGGNITWCDKTELDNLIAFFGINHVGITELGVDATLLTFDTIPLALKTTFLRKEMDYIKQIKLPRAYIFTYIGDDVQHPTEVYKFAAKNEDGTVNLWWTNNFEPNPITVVHNFGS